MATLYLDYKNGDDAATGGTSDPLKTLAHALASHANNGDTLRLRGTGASDQIYRTTGASSSKTNLIIENDAGHSPVVSASLPYSTWTLTTDKAYTYQTAYTPNGCYMVWNGTTLFTSVSSIADVEATENTFFFDNPGNLVHVHIAGGGSPSTLDIGWAQVGLTLSGTDCTVRGITFEHDLTNLVMSGANAVVTGCTLRWPYHPSTGSALNLLLTGAAPTVTNCTLLNYQGRGIRFGTGAADAYISGCSLTMTYQTTPGSTEFGIEAAAGTGHEIHDCIISGYTDGVYTISGAGTTVHHCTLIDCWHALVYWEGPVAASGHHNVGYFTRDLGNTAQTHGFVLHNDSASEVHHNLFAYMNKNTGATPHGCGLHCAPKNAAATLHAHNNLFYNCKIGIVFADAGYTVTYDLEQQRVLR